MKIPFLKISLLVVFFILLYDISSAKRSSGGRSRSKSSGSSGWWGRRKSSSSGGSSGSSAGSSAPVQPAKPVVKTDTAKAKPCSSARRKSASRRRNKTTGNSAPSDSSSSNSGDSSSSQKKTETKSPTYSSPTQNVAESKPYAPSPKVADVKPSAPVEYANIRKQTSNVQQSNSNQQKSSVGWNIPGQQQNNFNTKSNAPQPQSNLQKSPIGWNVPGSKPNIQQSAGTNNLAAKGGWTSGYQTSGSKRVDTPIKKETSKLQQSSPNQPQPPQPGWNVPGQNNAQGANAGGWKSGYQTHGAAPPAYPHHNAAPPAYNGQTSWGAPPAYPGHAPGGYGGFGHSAPGGYGGYGHGYSQPGGYGGYGGHSPQSFGGYNPGYGGMSTAGMGMGRGGFGSVGGFGGGYGGYGGGGGYPMQKKQSFFNAGTIGSVVAGMLVYNMASSLISYGMGTKRPYNVVNYYNQEPNQKVEEIKLPANILTLCEGNATQLCGQGTQSICTQNGTVLCVATMNQAAPCDQDGKSALCVNTTVPCADANDPLCQNSTKKDKLEVDVNVPCFTNLTLDVNLVDKSQTLPNTQYTYCVTTMAIAGPEYNVCEDITNTNDYSSVLNGNSNWFLETDGFRRNYSVYNYDRPMESNGEINMPVTVLIKCSDNAMKICAPGTIPTCTTFNEIMCMASLVDAETCSEKNSTCVKSTIPCPEGTKNDLCQNKTNEADTVTLELPCFANITLNAPIPKFNLAEFNGTLPDLTTTSSYTYHFNYCVVSLALPGSDFDLCITKEAKEKQDKEKGKS